MTLQQVLIALHIGATHVTIDDVLCMVICIGKFASDRCWQAFALSNHWLNVLCAGKCVVAFDHYCMLINTTVGDSNHALFLAYCTLQWFLIMWGWMLAWHAVRPCYSLLDLTAAVSRGSSCGSKLCVVHMSVYCELDVLAL